MGRRQPLHPALTDPTVVYTDTLRFLCRGVLLICSILTTHPLHRSKNGANCGKLFQERMNRPDELCWSLVTVKGFYYGGGVHGIKANHRRMLYYDYTVANIAVISMKVVSVLLYVCSVLQPLKSLWVGFKQYCGLGLYTPFKTSPPTFMITNEL